MVQFLANFDALCPYQRLILIHRLNTAAEQIKLNIVAAILMSKFLILNRFEN
jgi:hypothetical protein